MEQEDAIKQELGNLQGIPLYKSFIEGWPQVKAFQARPDDLLISTYPKSGEWSSGRMQGGLGDTRLCNALPVLQAQRG